MSILELYLHQTAEIAPKTGRDVYGKPTTGTTTTVKCRFQEGSKVTKNQKGDEIGVDGEIWVKPTVEINLDDNITVDGTKYRVVKLAKKIGMDGKPDHIKGFVVYAA
jgi:hypothetical protein